MAMQSSSLPPLDVQRAPEGGEVGAVQSGWRLALREFASNRLAVIGFAILIFFVLFCFVGPLIYHTNQLDTNLTQANQPPSAQHLLGTDTNGFDELGRIMKGGQASLEIGFFAAFVAIVIGTLFGAVSGLIGGFVDSTMMRVVDIFLSIPFLFVVLILAVKFGASVLSLSLVIGFFAWQVPARLVRGEVLSLRERDFVHAARTAGASSWRLVRSCWTSSPRNRSMSARFSPGGGGSSPTVNRKPFLCRFSQQSIEVRIAPKYQAAQ